MYVVELDVVLYGDETAYDVVFDLLAGLTIDGYKIVTLNGPAGGWPVVRFEARDLDQLEHVLARYADGDLVLLAEFKTMIKEVDET